jgi:hypothetical protein
MILDIHVVCQQQVAFLRCQCVLQNLVISAGCLENLHQSQEPSCQRSSLYQRCQSLGHVAVSRLTHEPANLDWKCKQCKSGHCCTLAEPANDNVFRLDIGCYFHLDELNDFCQMCVRSASGSTVRHFKRATIDKENQSLSRCSRQARYGTFTLITEHQYGYFNIIQIFLNYAYCSSL